jgi:hypothetical protein
MHTNKHLNRSPYIHTCTHFFPMPQQPPVGPGPPHYQGFTITVRHTTLGRTPLDERSARRRHLYLTIHNIHKRQTSMPLVGFEPTIPASDRQQTYALDCWDRNNRALSCQCAACMHIYTYFRKGWKPTSLSNTQWGSL